MEHHAFLCSGGINKSRLNPLWDHRPIPRQIVGFRRWLESTHRRDCRYLGASKKNEDISFGISVTKSILTLAVPFVLFGIVDYKEIGLCLWLLFVYLLYAFFEEVGWRGYLYSELIGCKIIHRLLLTTLLWFFWHCRAWQIGDVGFFALLFLASFGLDKLIRDTHSLILVACFHGLFNFYFKCLSDPSHWSSIVCLVITIMLWLYIWYGPKVKICWR